MSCCASSRRSFSGLASFCVLVWVDFCEVDRGIRVDALHGWGAMYCAPTRKGMRAAAAREGRRLMVRTEDCPLHRRLYLKACWTLMRRCRSALPDHFR